MAEEAEGRLKEALAARRQKLERLRGRGIEPFALRFDPSTSLADIRRLHGEIGAGEETGSFVRVAGRIVLLREHAKLAFATIRDSASELQLFLTEEEMGEGYRLVEDLDLGDIVGAEGRVVKTRRGELSVRVQELWILSKALRPMPEKWHGVRDPELRYRQRYLDFAASLESRGVVWARAKALEGIRAVLRERGYLEVETPALHPTPGGALARPFVTHHRALDIELYLRIAPELYLKRLLIGGMERIYEIGRNFRNEGIDRDHNPEFTMLEAYQAYGDYEAMMALDEALVKEAALAVRGSLSFDYQGTLLDLEAPWRRVTVLEAVSGVLQDEVTLDRPDLASLAEKLDVQVSPAWEPGRIVLEVFEKRSQPLMFQPTFVKDFPREVSPLARSHRSSPGLTEQFDLIIAGMEIGPAYSELTDPDEQARRFRAQQRARRGGDEEAHPFDEDFLTALEHGMPPAGGLGLGVDRLTMILADVPSIREVILFPHLRPQREQP